MKQSVWVTIPLAIFFSGCSYWQVQEARHRAAHYEPVTATVVANRVAREFVKVVNAAQPAPEYRAECLLEYHFQGQRFRHWDHSSFASRERFRVETALGEMAPGTQLTVYANPDNPMQIALHTRGWRAYEGAFFFGFLACVCGFLSAVTLRFGLS